MVDALILETTFLIDLEREVVCGGEGPAHLFLETQSAIPLLITFTVAGELAAGPMMDGRARWERLIAPFKVLGYTPDVCWEYGRAFRYLKDNGLLIGANDLWIAATALANGTPLVTRNEHHFRRVPGLSIVGYA